MDDRIDDGIERLVTVPALSVNLYLAGMTTGTKRSVPDLIRLNTDSCIAACGGGNTDCAMLGWRSARILLRIFLIPVATATPQQYRPENEGL